MADVDNISRETLVALAKKQAKEVKTLDSKLKIAEAKYVDLFRERKLIMKDRETLQEFVKLVLPTNFQDALVDELGGIEYEKLKALWFAREDEHRSAMTSIGTSANEELARVASELHQSQAAVEDLKRQLDARTKEISSLLDAGQDTERLMREIDEANVRANKYKKDLEEERQKGDHYSKLAEENARLKAATLLKAMGGGTISSTEDLLRARKEAAQAKNALEEIQSKLNQGEDLRVQERTGYLKRIENLTQELDQYRDRNATAESRMKELTRERDTLHKEHTALNGKLMESLARVTMLTEQLRDGKEKLDKAQEDLYMYRNRAAIGGGMGMGMGTGGGGGSTPSSSTESVKQVQVHLKALQQDYEKKEALVSQLESQLKNREERIVELTSELAQLSQSQSRHHMEANSTAISSYRNRIAALEHENRVLTRHLDRLRSQFNVSNDQTGEGEGDTEIANEQEGDVEESLRTASNIQYLELQSELERKEELIGRLQADLREAELDLRLIREQKQEIQQTLSIEIEDREKRITVYQEQQRQSEEEIESFRGKLRQAQKDLNDTHLELQSVRKVAADMSPSTATVNGGQHDVKTSRQLSELEDLLKLKQTEITELKEALKRSESGFNGLNNGQSHHQHHTGVVDYGSVAASENAKLKEELKKQKLNFAETDAKRLAAETKITELEHTIAGINSKLESIREESTVTKQRLQEEKHAAESRCEELRDELVAHRQRARQLILEKEMELEKLQERVKLMQEESDNGKPSEQKIFQFARKQAEKETVIAQTQDNMKRLQDTIKEQERVILSCQEMESHLRATIRELERGKRRETVNMEYLKNIIVKYMQYVVSNDERDAATLVPVIATILELSPEELAAVSKKPSFRTRWFSATTVPGPLPLSAASPAVRGGSTRSLSLTPASAPNRLNPHATPTAPALNRLSTTSN